jgi:hypothetical protein
MLNVIYAECHKKPFKLDVVMLNVVARDYITLFATVAEPCGSLIILYNLNFSAKLKSSVQKENYFRMHDCSSSIPCLCTNSTELCGLANKAICVLPS